VIWKAWRVIWKGLPVRDGPCRGGNGDEEGDIVAAVTERGQLDGDDVEPVIEILAERAFLDSLFERFVGGGDHADVDVDGDVVADAADFAFLEDAQDPALEHGRHGTDFVEEDGAAVGLLEEALLVVDGAGEGAAAVAEEFGFEEGLGEGAAVDRDEGGELAPAVEVERFGDEFLAGAAFAEDEHGAFGVGDAFDHFEDGLHAGEAPIRLIELVAFPELFAQVNVLRDRVAVGERAFDAELEDIELDRFLEVIVGALFWWLRRRFRRWGNR
jgi:hypothetical protein